MKEKSRERLLHGISYLFLSIVFFWVAFPVFWIFSSSLMSQADQMERYALLFPTHIDLTGWNYLINNAGGFDALRNSLGIASIATLLVLGITVFSGYSLARFEFRGKTVAYNTLLLTLFVPIVINFLSMFILFSNLHLIDTWAGMITLYTTYGIVLATLLFSGFFTGLPTQLEDAAMIDGTTRMGAFIRVILPLMKPGIIAVALFTWTSFWGDIQVAYLFTSSNVARTLPVEIISLMTPYGTSNYAALYATGSLLVLPPLLLFIAFQKYFTPTLQASAWKG